MKKREVREEETYRADLRVLISDPKKADELLKDAVAYLSYLADNGVRIEGTDICVKIIPDVSRRRFLAIFYTIDNGSVTLHSIKSFLP